MADRVRPVGLRQIGRIDQRDVVVMHPAVAHAAVEAHGAAADAAETRRHFADLVEPEQLGPEVVRRLDVADVQHEMVEADRCDGDGWVGLDAVVHARSLRLGVVIVEA